MGGLAASGARTQLVPAGPIHYADGSMTDGNILPVLVGLGIMLTLALRYWFRRRQAARLADQLLDDVVKAKDAFRR